MRERADVVGIQIGIGIQRIRVYRARRMGDPLRARSQPVYTMYGFALSRTYDSSSERVYRARRWCAYTRYIAPRRPRDKSEIYGQPLFPLSLTRGTLHSILQSVPLSSHLIASLKRLECNLLLRDFRNIAYRMNESTRK